MNTIDYRKMTTDPHLLIAGTPGSGKSVVLHGIMGELMTNRQPENCRVLLIDPKRVELSRYRNIAFCDGYTSDAEQAGVMLDAAINLIEARFAYMEQTGANEYGGSDVYIIIDELADLMISKQARELKTKMQKILQIGRAAHVHIIAATQAPNRKVIPAELVLNFTNRLALRCVAAIESRQIINQAGAEKLPRNGQGLYFSPDGVECVLIPLTGDLSNLIHRWYKESTPTTIVRQRGDYRLILRIIAAIVGAMLIIGLK